MDTDASTRSVSHKTYPRRCVCARIYEFAMDRCALDLVETIARSAFRITTLASLPKTARPAVLGQGEAEPRVPLNLKNIVIGCPSRKSYPPVVMMQSGQDWCDDNGPRSLDGSS
jgi:hypothetical protein